MKCQNDIKKRSIFAKWALQNNSDAIAPTHIKCKIEITENKYQRKKNNVGLPTNKPLFCIAYLVNIERFFISF